MLHLKGQNRVVQTARADGVGQLLLLLELNALWDQGGVVRQTTSETVTRARNRLEAKVTVCGHDLRDLQNNRLLLKAPTDGAVSKVSKQQSAGKKRGLHLVNRKRQTRYPTGGLHQERSLQAGQKTPARLVQSLTGTRELHAKLVTLEDTLLVKARTLEALGRDPKDRKAVPFKERRREMVVTNQVGNGNPRGETKALDLEVVRLGGHLVVVKIVALLATRTGIPKRLGAAAVPLPLEKNEAVVHAGATEMLVETGNVLEVSFRNCFP